MPSTTDLSLRVFLESRHRGMPNIIVKGSDLDDIVAYMMKPEAKIPVTSRGISFAIESRQDNADAGRHLPKFCEALGEWLSILRICFALC